MSTITTLENIVIGEEIYAPKFNSLGSADVIDGCEVFSMDTVASVNQSQDIPNRPIIISDGKTFNIYLNSTTMLGDHNYVNELCITLDNIQHSSIVNFYLGSSIDDTFTISISPIIVAIQNIIDTKRAVVNTFAYGFCSVPETMIWSYGENRIMGEYGCIRFGGSEWIQRMEKVFQPYINTYLNHCKSIGVLTDDQIDDIVTKQKEIVYIQEDGQLKAI